MKCPSCGHENNPTFRFCVGCGTDLRQVNESPVQPVVAAAEPIRTNSQPVAPVYSEAAARPVEPAPPARPATPPPPPPPDQNQYRVTPAAPPPYVPAAPAAPPAQVPPAAPYYYPSAPVNTADTRPMTIGQYIGAIILSNIPMIGFILLLVWAFSSGTNVNKRNFARAILILALIGLVLTFLIFVVFLGVMIPWLRELFQNSDFGFG